MKSFLFTLAFLLTSIPAQAGSPVLWGSPYSNNLEPGMCLNNQACVLSGSLTPTSSAVNAPKGSIYLSTNGNAYTKQDAGSSTNWTVLGSSSVAGSNTQIQFNNSGSPGASLSLTWNGTALTAGQIIDSGLTASQLVETNGSKQLVSAASLSIALGGTGQTTAANAINALLPSQTSNSGKVLGTNGTVASWVSGGGGGGVTSFNSETGAISLNALAGSNITLTDTGGGGFTIQTTSPPTPPGGSSGYFQYNDGSGGFAGEQYLQDLSGGRIGIGPSTSDDGFSNLQISQITHLENAGSIVTPGVATSLYTSQSTGSGPYTANGQTINYIIWTYVYSYGALNYSSSSLTGSFTDMINDGGTQFSVNLNWSGPGGANYQVESDQGTGSWIYFDVTGGGTSVTDNSGWSSGQPSPFPSGRPIALIADGPITVENGSNVTPGILFNGGSVFISGDPTSSYGVDVNIGINQNPSDSSSEVNIGNGSQSNSNGVAIGYQANATAGSAVSVGISSNASGNGTALGAYTAAGNYGAAVGNLSEAYTYGAAIGSYSNAEGYGVAIGYDAKGYSSGVSVGYDTTNNGNNYCTEVGYGSNCGGDHGAAFGDVAYAYSGNFAGGSHAQAAGPNGSVAIGGDGSGGKQATVPSSFTTYPTVQLGQGQAVTEGGLNFGQGSSVYTVMDYSGVLHADNLLKLHVQASSSTPTCNSGLDGLLALTHAYILCVCKGGSSSWVTASTGTVSCTF